MENENKVITKSNYHVRPFLYRDEVPDKVLEFEFDWLNPDEWDGFIKYRGRYYHTSEFIRFGYGGGRPDSFWDGYHGDSFFSATVIKILDDGESYIIGYQYC